METGSFFHVDNILALPMRKDAGIDNYLSEYAENNFLREDLIRNYYLTSIDNVHDASVMICLKVKGVIYLVAYSIAIQHGDSLFGGTYGEPIEISLSPGVSEDFLDLIVKCTLNYHSMHTPRARKLYMSLANNAECIYKSLKPYLSHDSTRLDALAGRYIDLQKGYASVRAGYRKSFKPLITKTKRSHKLSHSHNASKNEALELFQKYRDQHLLAAGRQTRSNKSWDIQKELLERNDAIVITLSDESGVVCGAAYFVVRGPILCYWSGAYSRKSSSNGISHLIIDKALQISCELGISKFYFGYPIYPPQQFTESSEKNRSLRLFRQGFSSSLSGGINLEIANLQTSLC